MIGQAKITHWRLAISDPAVDIVRYQRAAHRSDHWPLYARDGRREETHRDTRTDSRIIEKSRGTDGRNKRASER